MDTKQEIAVDMLARIKQDRIKVANSELAIIPAALRLGIEPERVAHLTGAPIERVKALQEGVDGGAD